MFYVPMRVGLAVALLVFCGGCADRQFVAGNDLGGLIDWTPGNELIAEVIAIKHCKQFGRAAYVTRINRRPGEYISFRCLTYPVDRVTPPLEPAVEGVVVPPR